MTRLTIAWNDGPAVSFNTNRTPRQALYLARLLGATVAIATCI